MARSGYDDERQRDIEEGVIGLLHQLAELRRGDTRSPSEISRHIDTLLLKGRGELPTPDLRRILEILYRNPGRGDGASLLVERRGDQPDRVISLKGISFGAGSRSLIAGPCAVEHVEDLRLVAKSLVQLGGGLLRGGAYKPRSSPYTFQGLGEAGLEMLRGVGEEFGLAVVTEVVDTRDVEKVARSVDVLQIGTRNMFNYELLKECGRAGKVVLLKRGFMATIEEWLYAAEYLAAEGCLDIILCERGIRTFERATRNTLDLAAVSLVKRRSFLPVIVDLSHATGRRDLYTPLGRASLAAGADGIMLEVHPDPDRALSDHAQQLALKDLPHFHEQVLRR